MPTPLPRVREIYVDDTGAIHDRRSGERIIIPGVSPDELLDALAEADRSEGRRLVEIIDAPSPGPADARRL